MQISTVEIEGLSIAIREAGPPEAPAFLLLHGWPQSSYAFERVISRLAADYRVVAPDLPCIGGSQGMPRAGDKRTLARLMRGVAEACGLRHLVVAGHDVGGQIVFALLRDHPEILSGAVIMDVVIPGVAPLGEGHSQSADLALCIPCRSSLAGNAGERPSERLFRLLLQCAFEGRGLDR
ncbi:alpha/beta fold hydrolase [Mesorhizobium sp. USDA 4775]